MPDLPKQLCSNGCGTLAGKGGCPTCKRAKARRRLSSKARGYGTPWWKAYRLHFIERLVLAGIAPFCGAALPDGPRTSDSACAQDGVYTYRSTDGSSLHLDHAPALTLEEQGRQAAMCEDRRVQLLCAACHARKEDPGRLRAGYLP
jgi:hypothetical protein